MAAKEFYFAESRPVARKMFKQWLGQASLARFPHDARRGLISFHHSIQEEVRSQSRRRSKEGS